MKNVVLLVLCTFAGLAVCKADASASQNLNITTEGNLESTRDIGCVKSAELSNQDTPADLFKGLANCIDSGAHDNGVLMLALAGVYGRYDTLRVTDASAHQAIAVLKLTYVDSRDEAKKKAFFEYISKAFKDPSNLAKICAEVQRLGPPEYFPRYMIQHGLQAFTPNAAEDGLAKDFDAPAAWKKSLDSYLHCPKL